MTGTERLPFLCFYKLLDAIYQGSLQGEGETNGARDDFVYGYEVFAIRDVWKEDVTGTEGPPILLL